MNVEQRRLIRGLIKKYSGSGTESLIAFVAETNGMFAACQALLKNINTEGPAATEWLHRECSHEDVTFQAFLREVDNIVTLFRSSPDAEDHHATLGISATSGLDEIKQAYRTLSRRYHPDTASPEHRDNPEKFIAINKAYQALLSAADNEKDAYVPPKKPWRKKKARSVSPEQRKRVFTWSMGLLVVLVVISVFASLDYRKRAMLAGLQASRGAFIPPAQKAPSASTVPDDEIDNQSTVQPAANRATVDRDAVAKVEPRPDNDVKNLPPKELPTKDAGSTVAPPEPPAEETPKADQPVESRFDRDAVAKVEPKPEDDLSSLPLKELPTKDLGSTVAPPEPPAEETPKADQPDESRSHPVEERQEVVEVAVDPSSNKEIAANISVAPPPDPAISSAEKDLSPAIPIHEIKKAKVKERVVAEQQVAKASPATVAKPAPDPEAIVETTDRESRSQMQPAPHEQSATTGPDVVVTTTVLPADPDPPSGEPEKEMNSAGAAVTLQAPLATAPSPKADDQGSEENNLETRVERFLANYLDAYQQRNLIVFSRFFDGAAEENGKPFTSILPTYLELFAETRHITMRVDNRTCRLVDGMIAVDGQFRVFLEYNNNRKVTGSGPIHFLLAENGKELLVKKMDYVFHTE